MTSQTLFYGRGEIFEQKPRSRVLVVIVHGAGLRSSRSQSAMLGVAEIVREVFPESDYFIPRLQIEYWRSQDPAAMTKRLALAVELIWQARAAAGTTYQEVILVGFSFGSVIARRMYCEACGADDQAVVKEGNRKAWARAVSRVVLLAGMNRGWTVASPVNRIVEGIVRVSTAMAHVLSVLREPTMFAIRRGAPFLTLTRLQWMAANRRDGPITVQLLGTTDDLVSPADNIDLATGADFYYLEVPYSGHFDVIEMSAVALAREKSAAEMAHKRHRDVRPPAVESRRHQFRAALESTREQLSETSVKAKDLADAAPLGTNSDDHRTPLQVRDDVKHVVFVMHGIRDKGFWTQKIARSVKAAAPVDWHVRSWSSTYGYFAMLPFLSPWTRRTKVEWFLDQYVSARALYPKADFSFVGHSNGTYLLGSALERCRAVRFRHAVLAGSVLRTNFRWKDRITDCQIRAVRNYVATADWVVAIFPRLFELVPFQDLGSAGHDGFRNEPKDVRDVEYIRGRHGAALDESRWPEIASFLLYGPEGPQSADPTAVGRLGAPTPKAPAEKNPGQRHIGVVMLGHLCPLVWLALLGVALAPLLVLLQALGLGIFPDLHLTSWQYLVDQARRLPPWGAAIALFGWGGFLRIILLKV